MRQAKYLVIQFARKISIAIGEKDTRVELLAKSMHIALVHRLNAILIPLRRRLVGDLPVGVRRTRYALDALEHILLADQKARDVHLLCIFYLSK